jgi:prolyl-tRNA synthetase
VCDETVLKVHDTLTGALEADNHFVHVEPGRDFTSWLTADVRTVKAGDACPLCGKPVTVTKGNELGHIFQLGYKYTKSMKASYLDNNGKAQTPTMGCYGIGIDRTLASVIEEHHDDNGIVWPMSLAPYHVVIVPIQYDGDVKAAADSLHDQLAAQGVEVLLDDRNERPGVKFKDADLLGIPVRITVGAKNLPANVEVKVRSEAENKLVAVDAVVGEVAAHVKATLAQLNR